MPKYLNSTKNKIILSFLVAFIIIFIFIFSNSNKIDILNGTYLCKELPFASFAFDIDHNNTFYYYKNDPTNNNADIGHYTKITDKKYIINSSSFKNEEISINKNKIIIEINNINYNFYKFNDLPIIRIE